MTLTRPEHTALGYLADGLTAEAIARHMSTWPATVRKHPQNLYAKLGTCTTARRRHPGPRPRQSAWVEVSTRNRPLNDVRRH